MATPGAAINATGQTYGQGEVTIKGAFIEPSTTPTVVHGKGWTVARTASTGCYLVTLQQGFKAVLSGSACCNAAASVGVATYTHPGFAICGELQASANTFYIYVYSVAATQQWIASAAAGTLVEFDLICSTSLLNT